MAKKPVSYLAGSMLLGTAIGAVVGLLASPRSGAETRAALGEQAKQLRQRMPRELTKGVSAEWTRLQRRGAAAVEKLPSLFSKKP